MFDPAVRSVLEESQRLGFLGERSIDEVIEHARSFVSALDGVTGVVADLGSGGGVPGLVIAHDRPDLRVVLVDRRAKRTDFCDRVIRRLHWTGRVSVICADVETLIGGALVPDAAVARGFGPPTQTLSIAARMVKAGGRIVISEPPGGERWSADDLVEHGVVRLDDDRGRVSIFETAPS